MFKRSTASKPDVPSGAELALRKLIDSVDVPYLQLLSDATLKVIKVHDTVKSNQEECAALAKRAGAITTAILTAAAGKTAAQLGAGLMRDIEQLERSIGAIAASMTELATLPMTQRIARSREFGGRIKGHKEELENACSLFQIQGLISLRISDHNQTVSASGAVPAFDIPSSRPPPKPAVFVGREEVINSIISTVLGEQAAHVAILGAGGIGKTAVALTVLHNDRIVTKFNDFRFFVACDGATSADAVISLLATALKVSLQAQQHPLDVLLGHLHRTDHPVLLVLDNLESAWDTPDRRNVENFLAAVASLNTVALMVTLRGSQRPAGTKWTQPFIPPLQPLGLPDAHQLFAEISDPQDANLDSLLQVLEGWPLAIHLMAALAQTGVSSTHLLKRWEQEQASMLNTGDDRGSNVGISIEISLKCNTMQRDPEAQRLISLLSLLPDGVVMERLQVTFTSIPSCLRAASTLQQTALAYLGNGILKVLSPIRSHVQHHHPPLESDLTEVELYYVELAGRGNEMGTSTAAHAMALWLQEQGNLQSILLNGFLRSDMKETMTLAILGLAKFAFGYKLGSCNTVLQTVIAHLKKQPVLRHLQAACIQVLGDTLYRQSHHEQASALLVEAKEMFKEIGNPLGQAQCTRSLGDVLHMQSHYEQASALLVEAKEMFKDIGDQQGQAKCTQSLGDILYMQSHYEQASALLVEAKEMFKEIGNQQGQAQCTQSLGNILLAQCRYEQAFTVLCEVEKEFKRIGSQSDHAHCLQSLGRVLYWQGHYKEALTRMLEAKGLFIKIGHKEGEKDCTNRAEHIARKL